MNIDALSLTNQDHTLLIVDDDTTILKALTELLGKSGFNIRQAQDGQSALTQLGRLQPDLILLDSNLSDMDGYTICQQIKRNEKSQNIPVIFMMALTGISHVQRGFAAGADDYIIKPIHQPELLARVATHLGCRQLGQWQEKMKQLEEEKTEALEVLNAARDKLFCILSHDLRSSFSSLLGNAELLADSISDPRTTAVDLEDMAQSIQISAKSAYDLLQNLLTWSRLQRGVMIHRPSQIYVWDLVERVIGLFAAAAKAKGISLRNEIDSTVTAYADQQMLEVILRNLISNAIKFTDDNGRVTIQACTHSDKNHVVLSVVDTGVGIPAADLVNLIYPEQHRPAIRTAQEHNRGLGLMLCQEMVQRNGGGLWAESEIGKGSTFTFTIPKTSSLQRPFQADKNRRKGAFLLGKFP